MQQYKRGLNAALDFNFEHIGPDRVVVSVDVGDQHLQPFGIVHGGVFCTLVETSASIGAGQWFGNRGRIVGIANQTDFFRPVTKGTLTATAEPIQQGRTQQVWQVIIRNDEGKLVARGQLRIQNIPNANGSA